MKTCVIIPCYKVLKKIETVLKAIDLNQVDKIFVIDDNCPEKTGEFLKKKNINPKIEIIILNENLGVGGATIQGFKKALNENFEILFKIDGDGQHNPADIIKFKKILISEDINFCKGSRFINKEDKKKIPKIRYFGNIILTYLTRRICKIKNLTDAVNGYIAIKSDLLKKIDLEKVSYDYFFEEDLLFNLSFHELKIKEIRINTIYFNKSSSLNPLRVILPFFFRHLKNYILKLKYEYNKKKSI